MKQNEVWRIMSKDKNPIDRRLLDTMWVFKVKINGIFKAWLVTKSLA